MMKYEVKLGQHYEIVEAGNPIHACILMLREIDDLSNVGTQFIITELHNLDSEAHVFNMKDVVKIMYLANNQENIREENIDEDSKTFC